MSAKQDTKQLNALFSLYKLANSFVITINNDNFFASQ